MALPAGCPLTARQYEVTLALAQGLSREQIAQRLGCRTSTVHSHIFNACVAMRAHSAGELVSRAYEAGWMPGDRGVEVRVQREQRHSMLLEEKLAAALRQISREHARARKRRRDQVTPAQALYLHAFERWLRAPDSERRATERALCLRAMFHEASWRSQDNGGPRISPPWELLGRPQPRRGPGARVFPIRLGPA